MIPTIAIAGPSGSGKTTLLEKIIRNLAEKNIRVGTIKHHLKDLDMDREGKDSWRHKNAGAKAVMVATPKAVGIIRDENSELDITDLVERFLFDVDIVIAEGYKTSDLPTIMVVRAETKDKFDISKISKPVAIASDYDASIPNIPKFNINNDKAVTEFIVEKFIDKTRKHHTHLFVNGKTVPMKDFVRDLVENTVRGLISSFRGTEDAKKITILIDDK